MDEMRKAFEAHCAGAGLDTSRVMDGPYKRADTQYSWEAWQAATMAERERQKSFDDRMTQIEKAQSKTLDRINAIENAQADHYRNRQRMPGPFGR